MLEQGALIGAGAVVKAPEGGGDWEFETGVQCLGGGGKLGRFVKRLQLACLPGKGASVGERFRNRAGVGSESERAREKQARVGRPLERD